MVLEAVMVVVDNSEHSRNGDYQPSRFESQVDAVNVLFQSITQGNPESSVGLMSMAGKGPEVLVTLTVEQGKILDGLHRTKKNIGGESQLKTSIKVAALALKHRQNRSQRARIIVFVCSPVTEDEKELLDLAKMMKKQNTSVDFVLFGEFEETQAKLQKFIDKVKSNDGSHLVVIPPSHKLLSDQLIASPILLGEAASGGDAGGDPNNDFEFGFDPDAEPELALALRMSMEEERARQAKVAAEEASGSKEPLEGIKEEGEGSGSSSKKDDNDKKGGDSMDTS